MPTRQSGQWRLTAYIEPQYYTLFEGKASAARLTLSQWVFRMLVSAVINKLEPATNFSNPELIAALGRIAPQGGQNQPEPEHLYRPNRQPLHPSLEQYNRAPKPLVPLSFGAKVVINGVECDVIAGTEEMRHLWEGHPRIRVDGQLYAYSINGFHKPTVYAIEG